MRTFEHFPQDQVCPICGSSGDGESWLMGIDGTGDGSIEECAVVHVACTGQAMVGRMRYNRDVNVVYCRLEGDKP